MLSLQAIINEEVSQREHKEQTSWHPSKLGSCLTGCYLERMGVEADKEFDNRTLRVFSVGNMFEEWVISKVKVPHDTQIRTEKDGFTGRIDLIIEDIIYEIKSKHSRAFWYMQKEGQAPIQNRMQLWFYLYATDREEGKLLFLSKDDLAMLEYEVRLDDEELRRATLREVEILNRAWEEKLPPQVEYTSKDWQSKYCRWHTSCISQEKYLEI